MSETSVQPDSGEHKAPRRSLRVQLILEVLAGVVLLGVIFWLARDYEPRTLIGRALLTPILWVLVLLISAFGTAGSLIPYHLGQRGTEFVFERYPQLQGRPWERIEAFFRRLGAPTLILSGIPLLGTALLLAAGAFGIERGVFLCWVFAAKVLRYWVLALIALFGLQLVA
jgi:membrane protein YqaA with SNARE-associated domain